MFLADTNILIYAADESSPFHSRCYELLENWRKQAPAWYLSWGIIYEFLRVSTHPRVFRNPWPVKQAWSFIEAILAVPALGILIPTERHALVVSEILAESPYLSGNIIHDLHTAALMKEHGIKRIYTRDTDFHRFSFLEPIDPLS